MHKPKRTPSRLERIIGVMLLLLLLIIAIGIYIKGQHYDPNIFSPDISKYQQPPSGPTPALPKRKGDPTRREAVSNVPGLIDTDLSQDWKPMGEVEFYNADNLYEKINGKAEQYLEYDVVGLQTVTFINEDGKRFVDLYVYDMGEPLNAFGIFSALRYPDEPSIDLGQGGYKSDAYFFWKGKYYTQIILSDSGEEIEKFALNLARNIESKQKELPVEIWGIDKFPKKELLPNSIHYLKKEGLNLSFLNDVYAATYLPVRTQTGEKEGIEITAFLSRRKDESETNQIFEEYRNYLSKYGTLVDEKETKSESIIVGEMFGYYDVVFKKGNIIGGTNSVENREYAEEISQYLLSSLSSNEQANYQ